MRKEILLFVFSKLLKYLRKKGYIYGSVKRSDVLAVKSNRQIFYKWRNKSAGRTFISKRYEKIEGLCELCFCKMRPPFTNNRSDVEGQILTVEHKRPISKGGSPTDTENMLLVCQPCNYKRNQKLLDKQYKIVRVIAR